MRVIAIPLFTDNYAYVVFTPRLSSFLLVDPAQFSPVREFITTHPELQSRQLTHILSTHKHGDHSGENSVFLSHYPNLQILGGPAESVDSCTHEVSDGSEITVDGEIVITAIHTPCHTRGHIVYYVKERGEETGVAFTGDTLFIGGCGRFFEGTASDMHSSLQKIARLPGSTLLYPGHEYTVANLTWAAAVDRGNDALIRKLQWAENERQANRPTVPSVLQEELTFNPFLRAADLREVVGAADSVSALDALRTWKNQGRTSL